MGKDSSVSKRLIILANSKRPGGYCVAGVEVAGRSRTWAWVRPIGDRDSSEVTERERLYLDGTSLALLDIAEASLKEPRPNPIQPENWVLDRTRPWRKLGRVSPPDLAAFAQAAGTLWVNGSRSADGINNRIPEAEAVGLGSSLALIEAAGLEMNVFTNSYNTRKVYASFAFDGVETDNIVIDYPDGRAYRFDGKLEITGLGEPFSANGDSGSLVTHGSLASGLLFAGTEAGGRFGLTYANPIGTALAALDLELIL